jgi:hypothetical protein
VVRRKTLVVVFLLFVGAAALAVPYPASAQSAKDRFQQILDRLNSFGDVATSWSRALPVNERFVVLADFNDEAVLDKNTGLVWERTPHITPRWLPSASYHCLNANTGGQKGWRLPNITELSSLVDPAVTTEPMLPPGSPFDFGQQVFFWSGTLREGWTDLAWSVNFRHGFIDDSEWELNLSVLCVRGGPKVDAY